MEASRNDARLARWEERRQRALQRQNSQSTRDPLAYEKPAARTFTPMPGTAGPEPPPQQGKRIYTPAAPSANDPFSRPALVQPEPEAQPKPKRLSSRVSQPPGGSSSFSLGGYEPARQPQYAPEAYEPQPPTSPYRQQQYQQPTSPYQQPPASPYQQAPQYQQQTSQSQQPPAPQYPAPHYQPEEPRYEPPPPASPYRQQQQAPQYQPGESHYQPSPPAQYESPGKEYGRALRAQAQQDAVRREAERRLHQEAERADDARVAREAADRVERNASELRRDVNAEVEAQRNRERTVQAREDRRGYEDSSTSGEDQLNRYMSQVEIGAPPPAAAQHAQARPRGGTFEPPPAAAQQARPRGGTSSNVWASGANQNCGNYITDRATSRVTQPPGGRSSICFG